MNFPSERLIQEHYSELLREAETCRLVKQSQAEGKPRRGLVARLLAWLGADLAGVSQNLRNQHRPGAPVLNLPCCPERQP